MEQKRGKSGWWVAGAAVIVIATFTVLERLIEGPPSSQTPAVVAPAPPEVLRLEDGAIEIRHDFFRRTTIRLDDEEEARALYDCLTRGIEEVFGGGTEGWERSRMREEMKRVQEECLVPVVDLPSLP